MIYVEKNIINYHYHLPTIQKVTLFVQKLNLKYKEKVENLEYSSNKNLLVYDLVKAYLMLRDPISEGNFKILEILYEKMFFHRGAGAVRFHVYVMKNKFRKDKIGKDLKKSEGIFNRLVVEYGIKYYDSFKIHPECMKAFYELLHFQQVDHREDFKFRSIFLKFVKKNLNLEPKKANASVIRKRLILGCDEYLG